MSSKHFYYPYQYGSYLYIFTKKDLNKNNFENWLNMEFPNRYGNIDETFAGFKNLMSEEDFLIATNHDLQHQFDVIGKKNKIDQIISKFKNVDLNKFELENHEETRW